MYTLFLAVRCRRIQFVQDITMSLVLFLIIIINFAFLLILSLNDIEVIGVIGTHCFCIENFLDVFYYFLIENIFILIWHIIINIEND